MTYKSILKVQFDAEFVNQSSYGVFDDEILPEEHYTFEIPTHDLSATQLFRFFGTVARTMGHNEVSIMKGACSLAFNDMRSEEDMRKVAEEFDLKMVEDIQVPVDNTWEQRYWETRKNAQEQIADLKARLSRYEQPDNPEYTEEEMEAMTLESKKELRKKLGSAEVVCHDCGSKYGTYSVGCSSTWEGECDVCGKTKGVTEVRDYNYLSKSLKELFE